MIEVKERNDHFCSVWSYLYWLQGVGLVWLIGAMVCLHTAAQVHRALILFIQTLALYKSFTYLLAVHAARHACIHTPLAV